MSTVVTILEFVGDHWLWVFAILGTLLIARELQRVDVSDGSARTRADFDAAREARDVARKEVLGVGYATVTVVVVLALTDTIVRVAWPGSEMQIDKLAHPLLFAASLLFLFRYVAPLMEIPGLPDRLADAFKSLRNAVLAFGVGSILIQVPEAFAFDDTPAGYAVYVVAVPALLGGLARLVWLERRARGRKDRTA